MALQKKKKKKKMFQSCQKKCSLLCILLNQTTGGWIDKIIKAFIQAFKTLTYSNLSKKEWAQTFTLNSRWGELQHSHNFHMEEKVLIK